MQDKNAQALFDLFGFDFRKKEQENLLDEVMAEGDGEDSELDYPDNDFDDDNDDESEEDDQ